MVKKPDFIAELYYRNSDDGGRKTPAFSGYRPHVKFPFSEMLTSGQQIFIDKSIVYPGETIIAEISIISTEPFLNKLNIGLDFEFREGSRIIGTGKILKVLNQDLLEII